MTETEKTKFFIKYPDADPNRFVFRNEKVWFKINPDNEYRLLDIESDTYQRTPTWTKYLTSYKERGFGIWFVDGIWSESITTFRHEHVRRGLQKEPLSHRYHCRIHINLYLWNIKYATHGI